MFTSETNNRNNSQTTELNNPHSLEAQKRSNKWATAMKIGAIVGLVLMVIGLGGYAAFGGSTVPIAAFLAVYALGVLLALPYFVKGVRDTLCDRLQEPEMAEDVNTLEVKGHQQNLSGV